MRKCRKDNACRWNNDLDPPGCELQGGEISVQFNDIAVVRLDDVIKEDQVLLAAKLPAEQKGHGAEPASTVIGQGARMSNNGEVEDRSKEEGVAWSKEQDKEENFCDIVNEEPKKGTAAGQYARKPQNAGGHHVSGVSSPGVRNRSSTTSAGRSSDAIGLGIRTCARIASSKSMRGVRRGYERGRPEGRQVRQGHGDVKEGKLQQLLRHQEHPRRRLVQCAGTRPQGRV